MLRHLHIQNYALINELDIRFDSGLTIISGETGAGKSILLGALALILGQRADTQVLLDKTVKCIIEGTFDVKEYQLHDFFSENNLDYENSTSLRREINVAGKSRAFINDTPVNLNVLKEMGVKLVDIHSQHHNILLGNNQFQLQVVDVFAGVHKILAAYKNDYDKYRKLESQYRKLKEKNEKAQSDLDYFQFQFNQLDEAKLTEEEQAELESEQDILSHSEEIGSSLESITNLISEENNGILPKIREARNLVEKMRNFFSPATELYNRIESVELELQDLNSEIEALGSDVESDPSRLEFIRERLNLLYSLEQKHHVESVKDLIRIKSELQQSLEGISSMDQELEAMAGELHEIKLSLEKTAGDLSTKRMEAIPGIGEKMISLLQKLGIPNAGFSIQLSELDDLSPTGTDHVDFLFSANKNSELQNLKKVASGGELSRVMLSLKSLINQSVSLPTIIFDEIDSGVSGDIADRVGEIIAEMSGNMQVINITHLPQIASKGGSHYLVYKTDEKNATHTRIRLLKGEERVVEIAKMLSGKEMSDAAIQNARVLLKKVN